MSFLRKLAVISAALIFAACATGPPLPQVATPPQRMVQQGYSFIPLDEKDWYIIGRNEHQVALAKSGRHAGETFALQALPFDCPPFDTEDEFVRFIQEGLSQNTNPQRFKIVVNDASPYHTGGATCVKSHIVKEDHAAVKGSSRADPMVLDIYSLTCRHPHDASVGVMLTYSQRYYSGQGDPQLGNKATLLFNSIQFEGF